MYVKPCAFLATCLGVQTTQQLRRTELWIRYCRIMQLPTCGWASYGSAEHVPKVDRHQKLWYNNSQILARFLFYCLRNQDFSIDITKTARTLLAWQSWTDVAFFEKSTFSEGGHDVQSHANRVYPQSYSTEG